VRLADDGVVSVENNARLVSRVRSCSHDPGHLRHTVQIRLVPFIRMIGLAFSLWDFVLGRFLEWRKDDAAAAEHFSAARRRSPNNVRARWYLAAALTRLGRYEEAIEQYRYLAETSSNAAHAYFGAGYVLQETGKHDEAIAAYNEVIPRQPTMSRRTTIWLRAIAPREACLTHWSHIAALCV
jgi:tetratricopeptide (TPR) repeat protein